MLMTPTTTEETKNAPPMTLLSPTSSAPEPENETMLANTSLAPLPRDKRVTPAMVGDSLRSLERPSRDEQK